MTDILLSASNIGMVYPGHAALSEVNLDVQRGSYVTLLGPSGSGKTTLLSILGGFLRPTSGQIRIDGIDVTQQRPADRPTTTVFQDYALFPHMNVARNVGYGLRMRRMEAAEIAHQVAETLQMVGLAGLGNRPISGLSGGQRQRVALARALAVRPKVLLLDEPLGALDMHLRQRMQDELWRLQRAAGAVFIHVTHDQDEAMNLGDTVVVMNHGRIEDIGPPDRVYQAPRTAFVASFMGESNAMDGRVMGRDGPRTLVETPIGVLICNTAWTGSADLRVMFRPEKVAVVPPESDAGMPVLRVTGRSFQGSMVKLWAEGARGAEVLIKLPEAGHIHDGSTIAIRVPPEAVLLYPREAA
jgi:spermidine/putrescine transport system ATP-binding protein